MRQVTEGVGECRIGGVEQDERGHVRLGVTRDPPSSASRAMSPRAKAPNVLLFDFKEWAARR